jgi:hypothetical protein
MLRGSKFDAQAADANGLGILQNVLVQRLGIGREHLHRHSSEDLVHTFLGFRQISHSPKSPAVFVVRVSQHDDVNILSKHWFHVGGSRNGLDDGVIPDNPAPLQSLEDPEGIGE